MQLTTLPSSDFLIICGMFVSASTPRHFRVAKAAAEVLPVVEQLQLVPTIVASARRLGVA